MVVVPLGNKVRLVARRSADLLVSTLGMSMCSTNSAESEIKGWTCSVPHKFEVQTFCLPSVPAWRKPTMVVACLRKAQDCRLRLISSLVWLQRFAAVRYLRHKHAVEPRFPRKEYFDKTVGYPQLGDTCGEMTARLIE